MRRVYSTFRRSGRSRVTSRVTSLDCIGHGRLFYEFTTRGTQLLCLDRWNRQDGPEDRCGHCRCCATQATPPCVCWDLPYSSLAVRRSSCLMGNNEVEKGLGRKTPDMEV